jgi:segregation and condensation protein B
MKSLSLASQLEAVLFVAGQPLNLKTLAAATETTALEVKTALRDLKQQLTDRGITLTSSHDQYSLVTAPASQAVVGNFVGRQTKQELSQPALETLAIVAYQQPISKSQIDQLRGVASDQTLKNLLMRDLVCELGQGRAPGRPQLYGTTSKFLHYLGLADLTELPPVEKLTSSR